MAAVCEHVPYDRDQAVAVGPDRVYPSDVTVLCPCCGLTGLRRPDDDLSGDLCPYCGVQSVRVEETP